MSRKKRLSCEDYSRMPFDEKVVEHIRSCPRAVLYTTNLPMK
jgi:hypothetical protein